MLTIGTLQVLNIVLRLAWLQTVLGFREAAFLHRTALVALVACLEIIRRGIWNFFRYMLTLFKKIKVQKQIRYLTWFLKLDYETNTHFHLEPFRLENEHLNNVGKFRASNSVPLPFNHDEEDKNA